EQVLNTSSGKKERVGKLFQMHSNKENPVEEAFAGHIYAFIGLKDTTTGDTLSDPANPIALESMTFPEPVISVAIEPKPKSDQEKQSFVMLMLIKEDPANQIDVEEESAQPIIRGIDVLLLDILFEHKHREFKDENNVGNPQLSKR